MAASNIGDAPAKTFAELLMGPLVDVYVGANRKHWCLHRNLLCHHSEYFSIELGADSRNFNQKPPVSKTSKLELLEDDSVAFELLVKWLYQGKIDDVSDLPMEKKWDHAEACQNLYILCHRIKMLQLKNLAIDQFRKGCNEAGLVPGPEEMKPVYEKTPAGSPFRKLVSKIAARQIMDPDSSRDASSYRDVFQSNADFAIDIVNAIKEGAGGKLFEDPTEGDFCQYHEHENGDKCKKRVQFSPKVNGFSYDSWSGNFNANGEDHEIPKINGLETPTKVNGIIKPSNLKNGNVNGSGDGQHHEIPKLNGVETSSKTNGITKSSNLKNGNGNYHEIPKINGSNASKINGITKPSNLKTGVAKVIEQNHGVEVKEIEFRGPKKLSRTASSPIPTMPP